MRPALISGICSMKQLGVFVLPTGLDASPSQGYPPALKTQYCRLSVACCDLLAAIFCDVENSKAFVFCQNRTHKQ